MRYLSRAALGSEGINFFTLCRYSLTVHFCRRRCLGTQVRLNREGRNLSAQLFADHPPLRHLPLVTLYATDRCNSRCVTCDYWKHGQLDMSLETVSRLLPSFRQLGTKVVLLSGGEPLLNPEWPTIAQLLRETGLKVWLLTSGLSLAKHARRAAQLFDAITVSMDGTDRQTYAAIRGLDAFDKVCEGIRSAAAHGVSPGIRVTLQRTNYRQLPRFVELAKDLGARQVSFLAVDVANPHAFGRSADFSNDMALLPADLAEFGQILNAVERDFAPEFHSKFIAESPQKLRRILQYFAAVQGQSSYPDVRCNAPEFSAVIGAGGRVQPCFFIAGPPSAVESDLPGILNGEAMTALRAQIRAGGRMECRTCVCTLWRDLGAVAYTESFVGVLPQETATA
jgi:Fe-coproporphyrin III synthase